MSKNEDQTSPIFTAVRSAGVLRKNERAIDRILRVLVIKTTVTEDDLEAVQKTRTFSTQTSRSAARAAAPRSSRSRVPSAATICSSACTSRFRRRAWSPRPW